MVKLLLRQGGERWINYHPFTTGLLQQTLSFQLIAFFLDMAEIVCMKFQVREALLVTMQDDIILSYSSRNLAMLVYRNSLRNLIFFLYYITESLSGYV